MTRLSWIDLIQLNIFIQFMLIALGFFPLIWELQRFRLDSRKSWPSLIKTQLTIEIKLSQFNLERKNINLSKIQLNLNTSNRSN